MKEKMKKIYKWKIEELKIVSESGEELKIKAKKGRCLLKECHPTTLAKLKKTISDAQKAQTAQKKKGLSSGKANQKRSY